jgi:hypothetical protein
MSMQPPSSSRPALQKRSSTRGVLPSTKPEIKKEPEKIAEKINSLLLNETITLENAIRVKEALKSATKAWLFQFLKMDGLHNLISMLLKFQSIDDKEPNELRIQYELLLCVKSAMNSQTGLDLMISQPELVASLALNIDSEDSAICTQTLELLAVLMVSGENGARAVLEALDFFKLVTRERVRFQCLVDALHSNGTSFAFKRSLFTLPFCFFLLLTLFLYLSHSVSVARCLSLLNSLFLSGILFSSLTLS